MYARQFFQDADLLLAVGTSFSEGTTLGFGHKTIPERAKIIQIDTDPDQLGRNYPTELAIQANAKIALRAIIDGVNAKPPKSSQQNRADAIQQAKQAWQSEIGETIGKQNLGYASVLRALNDLLTGNEILTTSGMTGDTLRNIDSKVPIIHAGEFRAIGTALATAFGVKIGRPDARVICVTGDGSFMMEQQELATARYHDIPVMVLILRNNAYGGMKRDQQKNYGGRIIGTELFIPDLAKLAALYGAKGYSVTRKEELTPVFKEALANDDFVIIDVKMD
jgi:acetolactate synthase I/II/III large subunit